MALMSLISRSARGICARRKLDGVMNSDAVVSYKESSIAVSIVAMLKFRGYDLSTVPNGPWCMLAINHPSPSPFCFFLSV